LFRKQHKKDVHAEAIKKKRRTTNKPIDQPLICN
jgi:large subunit ribosomal protein L24e